MNKCECGYEAKNGRALHAHKLHCRHGEQAAAKCCDEPDWKLLSKLKGTAYEPELPSLRALGYKEFCDSCGEMR